MIAAVAHNCKSVKLASPTLAKAFASGTLTKVKLSARHNCCDGRFFDKELDFEYPEPVCDWSVFFATDVVDPAICVSPDGQTCVDKFYTELKAVYISAGGALINVITQTYDISVATASAIQADIDAQLANEGYHAAASQVTITDRGSGNWGIEVLIEGLPRGVVPNSIIMGNSTVCFARPYFTCDTGVEGAECVQFESAYDLHRKGTVNYSLWYLLVVNPGTGTAEKITFNFNFAYDINSPTSIDFTAVKSAVEAWFDFRGVTGVTFDITLVNGRISTVFSGHYEGFEPIRFFLENKTQEEVYQIEYNCTEFTVPQPTCEFVATVETKFPGKEGSAVVGVYLFPEPGGILTNIIAGNSYDISMETERDDLIAAIEAWFAANAWPDVVAAITVEDGIGAGSVFKVSISNFVGEVYGVTTYTNVGRTETYEFICGDIDYIPSEYSPDKIVFTPEGLMLMPPFFGGSGVVPDGVYAINLVTETKDGIKTTERACVFVDCQIKCDLISAMAKDPTSDLHHYYEAIKYAEECPDCECEKACVLYKELLTRVGKLLNKDVGICEPCSNC